MIRVSQLKLDVHHTEEDMKAKICRVLRIREADLLSYAKKKQSLDARKKPQLFYVYTVDVKVKNEAEIKKRRQKLSNLSFWPEEKGYSLTALGTKSLKHRPVIIGTGPAGLFCGYELARLGYRPILLERGASVEERIKDVEEFWASGVLNCNSNVQFGEGGAGTFSDGKLNTLVKDPHGRNDRVLKIFVENGAPTEILYQNKPHIGTDILIKVVQNMRKYILSHGGEVRFHSQVTDLVITQEEGMKHVSGLKVERYLEDVEHLAAEIIVLAIGHSARDTFSMLQRHSIPMEAKAFAVGIRIEHPQKMINMAQYGIEHDPRLPKAAYKLTAKLPDGRGVYTFCMCPGGYVVNASSEEGRLAVNGMSYHARDGVNANSAVVVTVTPEDYKKLVLPKLSPKAIEKYEVSDALLGMEFQRRLEEAAYKAGNGKIPVQLFKDFCVNQPSKGPERIMPQMKGCYTWGNVRAIFPEELAQAIVEGILSFGKHLKGYSRLDAIISGVESRTSSPVRILRDDGFQSELLGLYPCGEGAGYAGGITSAAIDGLKVAQAIAEEYLPF
ncbi:hypothetical protein IMSAGC018_00652 [Lachnospiraceae bacterium]|nr:hypothetical protein IMSAGC018_00652 [Lachnospiraceae bacterium]